MHETVDIVQLLGKKSLENWLDKIKTSYAGNPNKMFSFEMLGLE